MGTDFPQDQTETATDTEAVTPRTLRPSTIAVTPAVRRPSRTLH